MEEVYRINLPIFEGPFDLLLFFIERDELDIHDIPIAKVTNDFLDYLHQMQDMDIEMASEFILVAGTLMRIKARLLLPRPEVNEFGEEVDPREELVNRLLEYKRYKDVLGQLGEMEEDASMRALRGYAKSEEKLFMQQSDYPEEELVGIDLYALMRTFKRILERHKTELKNPSHVIRRYSYNIEEVKLDILDRVRKAERLDFISLILEHKERIYVVFCFLSVLELVQVQQLSITIGEGFNNFWLVKKDPPEDWEAEAAKQARKEAEDEE